MCAAVGYCADRAESLSEETVTPASRQSGLSIYDAGVTFPSAVQNSDGNFDPPGEESSRELEAIQETCHGEHSEMAPSHQIHRDRDHQDNNINGGGDDVDQEGKKGCLGKIKRHKCFLIVFSLIAILLILPAYGLTYLSVLLTKPGENNFLAVEGDVINCEGDLDWSHKNIYSSVSITQIASDSTNDQSDGLPLLVIPLERKEMVFHSNSYNGTTELQLDNTTERFLIPSNYNNRPLYMWGKSNVTIDVKLDYKTAAGQTQIVAYVLRGDAKLNSFYLNPSKIPQYEHKFEFSEDNNQRFQCILDRPGYYYIVVRVRTNDIIQFSAVVQFNYFSLDYMDYDLAQTTPLQAVGIIVHQPLHHSELVVCFSEEDSNSNTIHIDLGYDLQELLVNTIPLMCWIPIVLVCILLYCIYCIVRGCQKRGHQYQPVPPQQPNSHGN